MNIFASYFLEGKKIKKSIKSYLLKNFLSFKSLNLHTWIDAEFINLLQSLENSRKKDSFSSVFVNADPGLFQPLQTFANNLGGASGVGQTSDIFWPTNGERRAGKSWDGNIKFFLIQRLRGFDGLLNCLSFKWDNSLRQYYHGIKLICQYWKHGKYKIALNCVFSSPFTRLRFVNCPGFCWSTAELRCFTGCFWRWEQDY